MSRLQVIIGAFCHLRVIATKIKEINRMLGIFLDLLDVQFQRPSTTDKPGEPVAFYTTVYTDNIGCLSFQTSGKHIHLGLGISKGMVQMCAINVKPTFL